jgi:septum formation protein
VLLLASASPRRRELLKAAGLEFTVHSANIDETPKKKESPKDLVKRLAESKARASLDQAKAAGASKIIAADTVVARGLTVLNKPVDAADAARMIKLLSGRTHHVYTGVSVLTVNGKQKTIVVATQVRFRKLSRDDIARYVESGEGLDKAGAYAIQGLGAALIDDVQGSYTNVIGLPVAETLALLK